MSKYKKKSKKLSLKVKTLEIEIANLEAQKKQKELLFANMVHEIRTPIGSILGLSSVVLESSLNLQQREYVEDIKTSGELLSVLANDLLDFSKLEAGQLAINNTNFELHDMIKSIMSILNVKLQKKKLKFLLEIESSVPQRVCADSLRLSQV